ncbi:MAG: 7-cyano-7-deazaguanine synthase [Dehalococcoidia bacterium]
MSVVTLVSGGVDSSLMAIIAHEEGLTQFPLFIDYGQICKNQEWSACLNLHSKFQLPRPVVMNLQGFGQLIPSGLTKRNMRVNEDAFLPGRNLLFILAGCAYAYITGANAVAIGLLSQEHHLFPDQTTEFINGSETLIALAIGRQIRVITPLINFTKHDVLQIAKRKGIDKTYSCHAGTIPPCGICVSCQEKQNASIG